MMTLVCETKRETTLGFRQQVRKSRAFYTLIGAEGWGVSAAVTGVQLRALRVGHYYDIVYNVPVASKPHGQHSTNVPEPVSYKAAGLPVWARVWFRS